MSVGGLYLKARKLQGSGVPGGSAHTAGVLVPESFAPERMMLNWIRNARIDLRTGLVVIAMALTLWAVVIYVSVRDYEPEAMTGDGALAMTADVSYAGDGAPEVTGEPRPVNAPR